MTRASERTAVTSEAVPDLALTPARRPRLPPGIALSQIAEALKLRIPSLCNHALQGSKHAS